MLKDIFIFIILIPATIVSIPLAIVFYNAWDTGFVSTGSVFLIGLGIVIIAVVIMAIINYFGKETETEKNKTVNTIAGYALASVVIYAIAIMLNITIVYKDHIAVKVGNDQQRTVALHDEGTLYIDIYYHSLDTYNLRDTNGSVTQKVIFNHDNSMVSTEVPIKLAYKWQEETYMAYYGQGLALDYRKIVEDAYARTHGMLFRDGIELSASYLIGKTCIQILKNEHVSTCPELWIVEDPMVDTILAK